MENIFTYSPEIPDNSGAANRSTIAITNINCSAAHLVKVNKDAYIPAGLILSIMDYNSTYAITRVREGRKEGIVVNLATVDKIKKDNERDKKKKYKRASVQCVIFLVNGTIIVTATSTATIIKRYEDAIDGVNIIPAKNTE